MGDLKYIDFDVAIEPAGREFTARVFNSPVGQAASTFSAPFSDLEIENFLLRVGRSRHAVRRIESPEMASAKQFGGRLFDQVFAGEVRGCLRSSLDEASRQGAGLRVRLHLTKVPALADLPWEFLYNASMNRFLSLSVETPLVRYLELPERIRPLIVQPPLRVLMMISSPSDYPQLDVKRETAKITEALSELEQRGLVTVERQEDATLAELQRRLRKSQYHIFHFIGHGGFDAQADDGLLIMEDQENRGRRVSAQFLGTILHDHRPLRLAVLNACEGARASRGDPFAGTAQSLVQQGIPAVIAMQFEVTDEAAICFTREFYAAIAVGYPVDAALAEARKAIFAEVSEIEWGTPVLYMRSPDGKVFEIEQVSESARKQLHVSSLLTAARTATASNDHATAIEKLKEVLTLQPDHAEAVALLADVTREQELAEKEVAKAAREEERKEAQRQQELAARARAQKAAEPNAASGEATTAQSSGRRPVSWFFMGGALGAAAVIALLVFGGVALVMFMAGQQTATANPKPQPPYQSGKDSPASTAPANPEPPPPRVERQATPAPPLSPRRESPPPRTQSSSAETVKAAQPTREVPPLQVVPPPTAQTTSSPVQTVQQLVNAAPPAPPDPVVVTPALREILEDTIRAADAAEIEAYRTFNPVPLGRFYAGDILAAHIANLTENVRNRVFFVNRLHRQQFESFSVSPDGTRAQIRLTESWSKDIHAVATGQCISHVHERPIPQTLSLQLTTEGWKIYAAEFHISDTPQLVACHF